MFRLLPRNARRNFTSARCLLEAAEKNGRKLSPEEARAEAAKLALQSLKDVGSLFSSGNDEAVQPIDTVPVFKDPTLFGHLNLLHQGQILKELQEKYDKNWNKLTDQDKKLGYYIAYGDWGAREKFTNWNTQEPPLDLPFEVPSKIANIKPDAKCPVHRLEPVILAETPVRKDQFDTSKMDPVTKTFIYLTIFVMIVAILRDKNTGEEGRPKEVVVEDPHVRKEPQVDEKQEKAVQKPGRRWYYLWIR